MCRYWRAPIFHPRVVWADATVAIVSKSFSQLPFRLNCHFNCSINNYGATILATKSDGIASLASDENIWFHRAACNSCLWTPETILAALRCMIIVAIKQSVKWKTQISTMLLKYSDPICTHYKWDNEDNTMQKLRHPDTMKIWSICGFGLKGRRESLAPKRRRTPT